MNDSTMSQSNVWTNYKISRTENAVNVTIPTIDPININVDPDPRANPSCVTKTKLTNSREINKHALVPNELENFGHSDISRNSYFQQDISCMRQNCNLPGFMKLSPDILKIAKKDRKGNPGKSNKAKKVMYYAKGLGHYRQCFNPRFEYPRSWSALLSCSAPDCLLVFVGLCNIILLQYILVVLVFFAREEITDNTFTNHNLKTYQDSQEFTQWSF